MVQSANIFEPVEGHASVELSGPAIGLLTQWVMGMRLLGVKHGQPNVFAPGAVETLDLTTPAKCLDLIMTRCPDKSHPLFIELSAKRSAALTVLAGLMGTG